MKKLFVAVAALVLVFTLSSTSAFAQGLIEIGVKGGLNLANAWGDDVKSGLADWSAEDFGIPLEFDTKMRMGGAFGGFLIYSISDMFAIQPELLYTMKGVKGETTVALDFYDEYWNYLGTYDVTLKGTIKLSYLEIPVLAKIAIPTQGSVKPVLIIGPSLSFKLSAEAEGEMEVEGYSESEEIDISDEVSGVDFGLVFGAGVDVLLASGTLTFDARYNLGLTNVPDIEGESYDVKNAVISFMVGYAFALQ